MINRTLHFFLISLVATLATACTSMKKSVTPEYARESQRLLALGNQAVDEENYELARDYQRRLKERGFIGSWELKARLHTAEGEHEEALATVEEALQFVGDNFVLWTQKGNILSDLGRYPLSEQAYSRARECPEAFLPDIDFNEAIMSLRRKKPERALGLLDSVLADEEADFHHPGAREFKVIALVELRREGEIEDFIKLLTDEERSNLLTSAAASLDEAERREAALNFALKAARLDRTNDDALYYVREAKGVHSSTSKPWNLQVLCRRGGLKGYTSYFVVAESPQSALKFCREVESPDLELLKVESSELVETESATLDGVYQRTGIAFFEETGGS